MFYLNRTFLVFKKTDGFLHIGPDNHILGYETCVAGQTSSVGRAMCDERAESSARARTADLVIAMLLTLLSFLFQSTADASSTTAAASNIVVGPQKNVSAPAGAIVLSPEDNIANVLSSHAAGTTFFFKAGTYRTPQITPLTGDRFIGAYGATLNGAILLTSFSRNGGSLYAATGLVPNPGTQVAGVCTSAYPRCNYSQDLYFDGKPLHAVASLNAVSGGSWYFDYTNHVIYFADDPTGHTVELSYNPYAFGGSASNVAIQNLIVEKFASADQRGAIADGATGSGWTISNNLAMLNHGYGIRAGSGYTITGNLISMNGEMGLGGSGSGILISGNEIAHNVWNGTDCNWECGGAKFGGATNLTLRGNYVHDNQGDGLWDDVGSQGIEYAGNLVSNNLDAGISHEIGYAALIHDNVLSGNGAMTHQWGWQAQIQIQNSSSTKVYNNQLTLSAANGGNGITVIQQNRGSQYLVHDVAVSNNIISLPGGGGALAGWFVDFDPAGFSARNNTFTGNHYHAPSINNPQASYWVPNVGGYDFQMWQSAGEDVAGSADTTMP